VAASDRAGPAGCLYRVGQTDTRPRDNAPVTTPPYLAGLVLAGRRVVIVGGGATVARRIHRFLAAGADVTVVSPEVRTLVDDLVQRGRLRWIAREYADGDLDGAWYVMAATDRAEVNEAVLAEAERRRIFCVRADRGSAGSAVTPAVGGHEAVQVAVLAGGDHHRSATTRDTLVSVLRTGTAPGRARADAPDRPTGVAIVGGGPGDPELLTMRGARLLALADVVVVDRLAPGELLEGVGPDAEIVDASKIPYGRSMAQDAINQVMVDRARDAKFVVRLKGGDPFVFGRGYEEVLALAEADVPTLVVPGVTSAFAGPALAGIPVTHRGVVHEVVVVSGHVPPDHPDSLVDWPAVGRLRGTVVVLMGLSNGGAIAAELIRCGRRADTPVSLIADASLPQQRRVDTTLAGLAEAITESGIGPPALVVIGDVTRL
jgi:uroporphyrin-III C-methyltransferase / precorrin-2 dehydrogenase / sirohydrochlorin ferrochelatase